MPKTNTISTAARFPVGEAETHPPLDLSLGHIGTSPMDAEIDFVSDGPYTVQLDYEGMTATLSVDRDSHYSRDVWRRSLRKVEGLLATAKKSGMRVVRGVV
jgi:hypothetical protein